MTTKSATRVANRYKKATGSDLIDLLNNGLGTLVSIEGIIRGADKLLVGSKGRVYQSTVLRTLKALDPLIAEVSDLQWALQLKRSGADKQLTKILDTLSNVLDIPKSATVEYAISDIEFTPNASGADEITYDLNRLKMWSVNLKKWVAAAQSSVALAMRSLKKRTL